MSSRPLKLQRRPLNLTSSTTPCSAAPGPQARPVSPLEPQDQPVSIKRKDFRKRQVVNQFRHLQRWYCQAKGVRRYARSGHGYPVGLVESGDDPS
nr:hypothetical protein CFP56_33281 [Quercus suber]